MTMVAYYCLHKFHWPPSRFAEMPLREQILIIEMIKKKIREQPK